MLLAGSLRLAPRISPATLGTVADLGADANSNPPNSPPPGTGGDWRHARAGGVAAGDPARVPGPQRAPRLFGATRAAPAKTGGAR